MNIVCTAPNLANFLYNITHIELLATYSILPNKRAVEVYCNHSPHIYITCDLSEPTHVAEILSVRQQWITGIHTECSLYASYEAYGVFQTECVKITVMTNKLERYGFQELLSPVFIYIYNDEIYTYGIVKSLLINNNFYLYFASTFKLSAFEVIGHFF